MTRKYIVGDKVIVRPDLFSEKKIQGVIIHIEKTSSIQPYAVEIAPDYLHLCRGLHSCDDKIKNSNGWWCMEIEISLITKKGWLNRL